MMERVSTPHYFTHLLSLLLLLLLRRTWSQDQLLLDVDEDPAQVEVAQLAVPGHEVRPELLDAADRGEAAELAPEGGERGRAAREGGVVAAEAPPEVRLHRAQGHLLLLLRGHLCLEAGSGRSPQWSTVTTNRLDAASAVLPST
jgi:hypothetical protein